jgi:peptidoglycan L-alanyl-D-glutamate endopeptidase CwlK
MASRLLKDLEPVTRKMVTQLMGALHDRGLPVTATCTYRSVEEQDEDYAKGRTRPGKIVTYARGGQSPHNYRMACDLVFTLLGYSGPWEIVGEEARKAGLTWGGDWRRLIDRPHVERPDWRKYIV